MGRGSRKDSAPSLLGRERELTSVLEHVDQGQTVYITGQAGIGKTVLLFEAGQELASRGFDVITMSGHEATSVVPLAPLLRLCPPGVDDAGSAIIAELYRRSRQGRVTVTVDDAHLLDDATSAIVRQIAGADAIGLVVAVRTGEAVPPQIDSIATDRLSTTIELGPFDRETTLQLVKETLGAVHPETEEWLWQQSHGHPLYLREMIIAARETGALRQEEGSWRAVEGPVWTARLHALIARRLSDLEPEARRAVECVALGGELPIEVTSRMAGLDELADLDRRQILRLSDGLVKIHHPLFAESVLVGMDPDRANELRLFIARAIDESSDPDPVRSLALRLEADAEVDRQELIQGTRLALRLRLPEVAERFARVALDSDNDLAGASGLAAALAMQRRWDEAEQSFETAVDLAGPEDHPGLFESWVSLNFEYRDNPREALEPVERAREFLGDRISADLELILLRTEMFMGNLDDSISSHEKYRTDHELADQHALMVDVGVATSGSQSGAFDRARELTKLWLDADGLHPVELMRLRSVGVLSKAWQVGPRAVEADITNLVASGESSDDPDLVVLARVYAGMIMNEALRPEEALPHLERTLDVTRYALHRRHVPVAYAEMARTLSSLRGDLKEAQRLVDRVMGLPDEARWLPEAPAMLAQSRIDRVAGRDPHDALQRGLGTARGRSARVHEVFLLREAAYLGKAEEVTAGVREVASGMDGVLAQIIVDEVEALASNDPEGLDRVADVAAECGACGVAFDASAVAMNLHRMSGSPTRALAAEWRCRRILDRSPRYLSVAVEQMEPILSDREHEVVQRVVAGDSSREAAEALFISPRTVDSHLRRVYQRLGISGREELAAVVSGSDPLAPAADAG